MQIRKLSSVLGCSLPGLFSLHLNVLCHKGNNNSIRVPFYVALGLIPLSSPQMPTCFPMNVDVNLRQCVTKSHAPFA